MHRGSSFHRRHVERIAQAWRAITPIVFTEHRVVRNEVQTFMDVFVNLQGYHFAVELELSTRHVLVNVERAFDVGVNEVHLVFTTVRLRERARRKLAHHSQHGKSGLTRFLLLTSYEPRVYVQECPRKREKKREDSHGEIGKSERGRNKYVPD